MNTTNKTILVTGGGSGIGFQIAKLFSQKGNKVIITGRDEERLKKAAAALRCRMNCSGLANGSMIPLSPAGAQADARNGNSTCWVKCLQFNGIRGI